MLLLLNSLTSYAIAQDGYPSQVAIIIDDMGYRYTDEKALNLPGNITFAFLPHTTYGKKLALQADYLARDILIHIPMESENKKKLGPGALTSDMDQQAVNQTLSAALAELPFAIGINNHMGSYLTQRYQTMAWTMDFLRNNNLLFLDSKTSPYSQAEQAAIDYGVPVRTRHVFLDNELTEKYIEQQFNQLINIAQQGEGAIAIAHPHPETIEVLTKLIPSLKARNVELVPLSRLYRVPNIQLVTQQ